MSRKFSLKERIKSFKYAWSGFVTLISEEHNARIHFVISLLAIASGLYFGISHTEWLMVLFAIGLVIVTEALNSSIEALSDHVCPQEHKQIKKVKDLAAFAVLFSALIAILIGLIIFLPKIMTLCKLTFTS